MNDEVTITLVPGEVAYVVCHHAVVDQFPDGVRRCTNLSCRASVAEPGIVMLPTTRIVVPSAKSASKDA